MSQESHACAIVQRTIEELTLNAWPALQTVLYDGWLLRFADGYTRRANSVNPIYPSAVPLADKIAACERAYAARDQEATPARNQGIGRRRVGHLLAWGRAQGARTGHLAVVADNTPALRLYARLGFREAYRYWYRRQARQPHA